MRASARANKYWKRLAQSWGTRLADQYGPTCPDDWAKLIDKTDDDRLDRALATLRQASPQWPPTLGQFEAAIPHKLFGGDSIPDQLAQAATERFALCEHQLQMPWTYVGRRITGDGAPYQETLGVVIPACPARDCPQGGREGHRLMLQDLAA